MGVPGLASYILRYSHRYMEVFELQNMDLVIDGVDLYCNLHETVDKQYGIMGAQYDAYSESIKGFFRALLLCNVRPIVILDAFLPLTKNIHISRFEYRFKQYEGGGAVALPQLLREVFLDVLRELNIKFVQTITKGNETMVELARTLKCPILSEDSDFFMCSAKFIHLRTLNSEPRRIAASNQWYLHCEIYTTRKLRKAFNNINDSLLLLALAILGTRYGRDYLDGDIIKPLIDWIDEALSSGMPNHFHRRIEKTLRWLSRYSSLDEAITAVLNFVDASHKSKISSDIHHFIDDLGVCSSLDFTRLGLPTAIITKLNENHMRSYVRLLSRVEAKSETEGDDLQYTEQCIIYMCPEWLIEDLSNGRVRSSTIELLMFSTALLNPANEDPAYLPTGAISLPILKFIYSLICSLRGTDEDMLEVYSTKGNQITREKIMIQPSSINLNTIRQRPFLERKKMIDEVLGIDGLDLLQELPASWTLYSATMVFWMKQEMSPEKTNNHLFSVILIIILGIIDDKIGYLRSMDSFMEKYSSEHRRIRSSRNSRRELDGLNLRETLKYVTIEECIGAAPFFIESLKKKPPRRDWKVVHAFTQFHSCLKNSITLNSLLGYPYPPVPLHRVYNGFSFYKLFHTFLTEEDVESYLHSQLQYSPAILQTFSKLKDIMLGMIEGK